MNLLSREDWCSRFAARLDQIAPDVYDVVHAAQQQAKSQEEWWNTSDPEAWDVPELRADLFDYHITNKEEQIE